MADETEQTPVTDDSTEAPQASASAESPVTDEQVQAAQTGDAPDDAAAEVAPADAEGDEVAPADAVSEEAEVAAAAESSVPEVVLAPKERRAKARASKAAKVPAGAPRTAEERQAARDADRASKASARTRDRSKARAKYKAAEHERVPTPAREHVSGIKKVRQGIVTSDKADKTITVRIDYARRHPRYQKIVRSSTTLHAHDEKNDANTGDTVVVQESRPLSATKRWRLVEVVARAR